MHDVIIIGKGPAGISAALYTIRANLDTLILAAGTSALDKAERIENYYGLSNPLSGPELLQTGVQQVEHLRGKILEEEVLSMEWNGAFEVTTLQGTHMARSVLLATGAPVVSVPVKGLRAYEGKGVSYCTTCDGFFHRGKPVGIIGYNDFGLHEAKEMLAFTDQVFFFTNGKPLDASVESMKVMDKLKHIDVPITALYGEEKLEGVRLEDGHEIPLSGFFVAYGSATGATFALKMGIEMEGVSIKVNEKMATNIPGLFAAGDVIGGFKQVAVAVGQGALAGRFIIEHVRKEKEKG